MGGKTFFCVCDNSRTLGVDWQAHGGSLVRKSSLKGNILHTEMCMHWTTCENGEDISTMCHIAITLICLHYGLVCGKVVHVGIWKGCAHTKNPFFTTFFVGEKTKNYTKVIFSSCQTRISMCTHPSYLFLHESNFTVRKMQIPQSFILFQHMQW